jgi:ankyrin repeat protein
MDNPMKYETIHKAAFAGNLAEVKRHLQNGADVNAWDKHGETPLNWAAVSDTLNGCLDVAQILIEKGAGMTTLMRIMTMDFFGGYGLDMVKFLLAHGADVDARAEGGVTLLMMATGMGKLGMVKFLVAEGANVNARNIDGHTPIMLATGKGHPDIVEFLKQHGAKE